jgi:LPXTG-motif cell wall-anchored protein
VVLGEPVPAPGGQAPVVLGAGVSRPAAAPAQQAPRTLALTGGDVTTLALVGVALAAAGVAVLAVRRRHPAL